MKKILKFIMAVLPIIISVIALIISYLSYYTSKQSFEYGISKDMIIHTPAIKEKIDSLELSFNLNNDNSELQGICITLPNSIQEKPIFVNTKPINLSKHYLEQLAKNYLYEFVEAKDSVVIVGTFAIPIIIDYSAIAYGFPQTLRENRLLVFNLHFCDNILDLSFSNTYLISRCGYPLKIILFIQVFFLLLWKKKLKTRPNRYSGITKRSVRRNYT